MRHWEKSKKELRRQEERISFTQDSHKKKKLKPQEKDKYRLRDFQEFEE